MVNLKCARYLDTDRLKNERLHELKVRGKTCRTLRYPLKQTEQMLRFAYL